MKSHIKISFVGDLSLSGVFYKNVESDLEIFDIDIINEIHTNDFFVCNFEGSAPNDSKTQHEHLKLKSPSNSIPYLKERGINVFNLANNHIFDFGLMGFRDTITSIEKNGLNYFGAGNDINQANKICYLKENNITCALIGITDSTEDKAGPNKYGCYSPNKIREVKDVVDKASQEADWVILNYHGGEEYTLYPSPVKRKFLKKLSTIKNLDIIIAHHSHTFQGIEEIDGTTIFYSLGNFIFDYHSHHCYNYTNDSSIVAFNFTKNSFTYSLIPIHIDKEQVRVSKMDNFFTDHIIQISNFSGYYRKFMKDSYRRVFNLKPNENEPASSSKRLYEKSPLIWPLSKNFYKLFFTILRNKNTRMIYLSAILIKLLRWHSNEKDRN